MKSSAQVCWDVETIIISFFLDKHSDTGSLVCGGLGIEPRQFDPKAYFMKCLWKMENYASQTDIWIFSLKNVSI